MAALDAGRAEALPMMGTREPALVALHRAIRRLGTVVSFMNTGAHPDDEPSALLAYLSWGLGARTVSVIANRGEGGQNQLGDEYGPTLGVVRSRELEEASRVTGVCCHFLSLELDDPIYDFGFSRTPEETLERWGEALALERLVRLLRLERPDVVMPSFRDEYGQHGHHRAVTRLTLEAARQAASPRAFPEQLASGVRPWQVRKIYLPANPTGEGGGVYLATETGRVDVTVDVGAFDPVLGLSYVQVGEASRAFHRSQGMGRPVRPGSRLFHAERVMSWVPAERPERSFFDGLPFTVGALARTVPREQEPLRHALEQIQEGLDAIRDAFPDRETILFRTQGTLALVRQVLEGLEPLREEAWADDLAFRLRVKEGQLQQVSAAAALLLAELEPSRREVVRGQEVTLTLRAFHGGSVPLEEVRLDLEGPPGWTVERPGGPGTAGPEPQRLGTGETVERSFRLRVPDTAPYFHPYRRPRLRGRIGYRLHGQQVEVGVEAGPFLAVLPPVGVGVQPQATLLNTARASGPLELAAVVKGHGPEPAGGAVRLRLPPGWRAEPEEHPFRLDAPGSVTTLRFRVEPPPAVSPGEYRIGVEAYGDGWRSDRAVRTIEYDHIGRTYLVSQAEMRVVAFPWAVEPVRVGYVASGFDSVPALLERMGFRVTLLGPDDLRHGDLEAYDTIVLGVYAYRARPDLVSANGRLLQYVERGGHLVVQLHRPGDNWDPDRTPPYRLIIGRPSFNWRVTDEEAPVTLLQPDHPLFRAPNAISDEDWRGWKKDRGLYFPMEWSEHYQPLLAVADPGWEPMKGGLLLARYGEGTYLYTSLILYYQLEQHVPGAYRLMANLVSYPVTDRRARLAGKERQDGMREPRRER